MVHAGDDRGGRDLRFGWGTVSQGEGEPQPAARIGDEVALVGDVVPSLRDLIDAGPARWREVRRIAEEREERLALADVEPRLPVAPRDFVDFYASLEHATNVGSMLRPDSPLEPNWRHLPVGYHGRAASVVVSGTEIRRPRGQTGEGRFGPTGALDFECELGLVAGPSTSPGEPVPIEDANERIFGVVLLNDWSARDIQAWEYRPLGPFLGKAFATSISPWIVPLDVLPRAAGREQDPAPLPNLQDPEPLALDLEIEVEVSGERLALTRSRHLYWTPAQLIAHATSGGAPLTAGDLFGTGTISGPEPGSLGCMLELYRGERWLEDGDEVVLRCRELGECRGRVAAAPSLT